MKVVIMVGGKGTRIAAVNADVPKPMITICGKPILQHQIECLAKQGLKDVLLMIGHLGYQIEDYFGNGSEYGVKISYIKEDVPLGTAGALYYLKGMVTEDFLLINGDIIFDVDIERFAQAHAENAGLATIFTHPNSHPYDSGLIVADESGSVSRWLTKEEERLWYKNRVNAGLHMLSPKILEQFTEPKKTDLDRDVLKPLIPRKQLFVYDSPEYVKDMGTPERYYAVMRDIESGMVEQRNLSKKQKAIFLDRDGTINQYVGFLTDIDDMKLIDGAAEAIRRINEGAYLDDIFYCPHHPHKGYDGERAEYKIDCECRKPKPGMLLQAAKKYNIDLQNSWMIGDGENDIEAGRNAGCKVAYVGEKTVENIPSYKSLLECINSIL